MTDESASIHTIETAIVTAETLAAKLAYHRSRMRATDNTSDKLHTQLGDRQRHLRRIDRALTVLHTRVTRDDLTPEQVDAEIRKLLSPYREWSDLDVTAHIDPDHQRLIEYAAAPSPIDHTLDWLVRHLYQRQANKLNASGSFNQITFILTQIDVAEAEQLLEDLLDSRDQSPF